MDITITKQENGKFRITENNPTEKEVTKEDLSDHVYSTKKEIENKKAEIEILNRQLAKWETLLTEAQRIESE